MSKEQERGGGGGQEGRERRGDKGGGHYGVSGAGSVQATPSEVVSDDDVGHGVKHHLDVSCICGAGHVTVDFLIWRAVLALELCLNVSCCVIVGIGSWKEERERDGEVDR